MGGAKETGHGNGYREERGSGIIIFQVKCIENEKA